MLSTHPKVGMAVSVGVRVKAKVRALARRYAHSFLAVRAGRMIGHCRLALPGTSYIVRGWTCLRLVYDWLKSGLSLFQV